MAAMATGRRCQSAEIRFDSAACVMATRPADGFCSGWWLVGPLSLLCLRAYVCFSYIHIRMGSSASILYVYSKERDWGRKIRGDLRGAQCAVAWKMVFDIRGHKVVVNILGEMCEIYTVEGRYK